MQGGPHLSYLVFRSFQLRQAMYRRKAMASFAAEHSCCFALLLLLCALRFSVPTPTPAIWPHQFRSVLFTNDSGILQKVDLWYDWPNGRTFHIIQNQLGKPYYNIEWNNGTTYYYLLDPSYCKVVHFPVGILRPNWLDGATYLGQQHVDNFLCNVWQKVDFIWYYEDVLTLRPVKWIFNTVLEDAECQAPLYCFDFSRNGPPSEVEVAGGSNGSFMREISHTADAMDAAL